MDRREPPPESSGVGSFRGDLDLSGFIDKYAEHLHSREAVNYVDTARIRDKDEFEAIPRNLYEDHLVARPGSGTEPEKVGNGPLSASASRVLALARPAFAWDPNHYYRSLGIPWPYTDATRRDLTRAFMAVGGEDDHWLMYCLKQLLNTEVRERYDAMPLGKEFLDDLFVQQRKRHEAADEANRRSVEGDYTTVDDVLDEQGYVRLTPEEEMQVARMRALDAAASNGQDPSVGGPWQYAYYLWQTTSQDRTLLAQWQEALIREADAGLPAITVGMMGKQPHRFVIGEVDGHTVFFLNRDQVVTDELARAALAAVNS